MRALYSLSDVRVRLGEAEILHGISLEFEEAQMAAIVGPNGAGKSTLMSVLSGVRRAHAGSCLFRGRDVAEWKKRELAQQLTFIPQAIRLEFPFTAEQVVFMGRTPHCNGLFESPEDREAVHQAMEMTDTIEFAHREFQALSGGERQRVILASALAQQPSVLLLDEPTTHLDLKHQVSTYALLQQLAQQGIGVIAVTHDLNLASSYADRTIVLSKGHLAADGKPEEVLQADLLHDVFEVEVEIRESPNGRPWVFYEPSSASEASTGLQRPC